MAEFNWMSKASCVLVEVVESLDSDEEEDEVGGDDEEACVCCGVTTVGVAELSEEEGADEVDVAAGVVAGVDAGLAGVASPVGVGLSGGGEAPVAVCCA